MNNTETEGDAGKKLDDLKSGLSNSFGPELKCATSLTHASLEDTLKEMTAAKGADLIVMGTKGATGLKRILIGSNTVNVIAKTKLPVLVIPEAARFENFKMKGKNRIVLATDLEVLKDEYSLDILKEIALKVIDAKVRLVSVRPKNTKLSPISSLERDRLLGFFSPELDVERITVFSSGVMSGINYYLRKNDDTGLIAMVARDSGFLIQKHYTHEMASHTHLPLLVMHDS